AASGGTRGTGVTRRRSTGGVMGGSVATTTRTRSAGRQRREPATSAARAMRHARPYALACRSRMAGRVMRERGLLARRGFPYISTRPMASHPRRTELRVDGDGVRMIDDTTVRRVVRLATLAT